MKLKKKKLFLFFFNHLPEEAIILMQEITKNKQFLYVRFNN